MINIIFDGLKLVKFFAILAIVIILSIAFIPFHW